MSEAEFKNLNSKDVDQMTDDDIARHASDPCTPSVIKAFMQGVLMGRMTRHMQAFFPGLT